MTMKKIEAIVRPTKIGDVCLALNAIGHPGLTVTEVEGHGKQRGVEQQFRGKTYKVELITKARIEIIADDGDVEGITKAICEAACTGQVGDGKIFIYPVEDVIRIRTKERGSAAIG
jgi:nitrogen regulatory protein P-II 1